MRAYITLTFLIFLATLAHAGIETDYPQVSKTILTLGLDLDDFSTVWPLYCNPKWTKVITEELSKEIKFTREAIDNNFFSTEQIGTNIKLSTGKTCQALHKYYFDDKNSEIISTFINKDRLIRKKYGFSSIDLFKYPYNYQGSFTTYNQPPGQKELILRLIDRFRKENIFKIEEKIKNTGYDSSEGKIVEIMVPSYSTFRLVPTEAFISAHKRLRLENSENQ